MNKVQIFTDGELFQWEQKRLVFFEGDNLFYAQFYTQKGQNSIDIEINNKQAEIPSKLLTQKTPLTVIACDKDNRVLARKTFRILARPKPEFYEEQEQEEILFYGGNANGTA